MLSRRQFLAQTGGLTFALMFQRPSGAASSASIATAWAQIHADNRITILNPAAEMGQGSMTSLAVIVAEEMDADWDLVDIEFAPVEPETYGIMLGRSKAMMTVGSRSVMGYYESLRTAGAEIRAILVDIAADYWGVPADEISAYKSRVLHERSGRQLSFGEIAAMAPEDIAESSRQGAAKLKDPARFEFIGNAAMTRVDIPGKVDGSAKFSIDISLPDMLVAVVIHGTHGSSPRDVNVSELKAMQGVSDIVSLDNGLGIVGNDMDSVLAASRKARVDWADSDVSNRFTCGEELATYGADMSGGEVVHSAGNVDHALAGADRVFSADYFNDYVYHAQMEPLNAVVSMNRHTNTVDVWAGTQAPSRARTSIAKALGMPYENVTLHQCFLGGGLGRRSLSDYIVEAVKVAEQLPHPVKVIWPREEDVRYGAYRPMSLQRLEAGVDADGKLTSWRHQVVGDGGNLITSGANTPFYSIPNQEISRIGKQHGVRLKHWRAVAHGPNKFAIESFIDEIAARLDADPVEYRLALMSGSPRAQHVLRTTAEMADWGTAAAPGHAKGIAFGERSGSLAAVAVDVSIDADTNKIRVHHAWAAVDAGVFVQPNNAIAQIEGAIIQGIGSVLGERLTIRGGKVEQSNFHDYKLIRLSDAPESIEVKLISSDNTPTGLGEAGLPPVGGAIACACRRLADIRLRHMPFTPERVSSAKRV